MGDTNFLVPADPDNPGVHALAQDDGSLVLIGSADEAMTLVLAEPD